MCISYRSMSCPVKNPPGILTNMKAIFRPVKYFSCVQTRLNCKKSNRPSIKQLGGSFWLYFNRRKSYLYAAYQSVFCRWLPSSIYSMVTTVTWLSIVWTYCYVQLTLSLLASHCAHCALASTQCWLLKQIQNNTFIIKCFLKIFLISIYNLFSKCVCMRPWLWQCFNLIFRLQVSNYSRHYIGFHSQTSA